MSKLDYDGSWEDAKERLMNEFPGLTEEDFKTSNDEKLIIHLQTKLGKSKAELRDIMKGKHKE